MNKKWIDFFGKRYVYFIISGAVMLAGIIAICLYGVKLDIQFKGGAIIKYISATTLDTAKAADIVTSTLNREVEAQISKDLLSGSQRLVLNLAGNAGLDAADQDKLDVALKAAFPDAQLKLDSTSVVQPFIGRTFLTKGIMALLFAAILIMVYVWFRFKRIGGLSAGAMALVSLLHDLLVVFFAFCIARIPLGDGFVAICLTIMGYSINDTIVIYDRIRENARLDRRMPADQLVNKSVTQTLSRSINTNVSVLISIMMVYIFATANSIQSVQDFALPMAVGIFTGCYSTVCIAGPLWAMWQLREKTNKNNPSKKNQPKLKKA